MTRLPRAIEDHIENHEDNFKVMDIVSHRYFPIFGQIPILPNFYAKGDDYDRIDGAKILRRAILNHKLDRLDVAKKYLYTFRHQPLKGHKIVFAEAIDGYKNLRLDDEDKRQLKVIQDVTGFNDFTFNIIRRKSDDKIVFIDTQLLGFSF